MTATGGRPRRLMLHIGAHKTATTHFEDLCSANARLFEEAGVTRFPKTAARLPMGRAIQHVIARQPLRPEWTDLTERYTGARALYVMEENILGGSRLASPILGGLYPSGAENVTAALNLFEATAEETQVLLTVRAPETFFPSAWSEAQRHRTMPPFWEWMGPTRLGQPYWLRFLERLTDALPEFRFRVWTYESYIAQPERMLPLALGQTPGSLEHVLPVERVVRPGPSARALAEIQRLRAARHGLPPPSKDEIDEVVETYPKGDSFPGPDLLSDADRAILRRGYAEDLERIAALRNVTLVE